MPIDKDILNTQQQRWEKIFGKRADFFDRDASPAAHKAAEIFKTEGITEVLELGGGQGRDTLFFAQAGFRISVLDYSQNGIDAITQKACTLDLSERINALTHDIRKGIPFTDESFSACYSHMLYCMAFSMPELEELSGEVLRILKPGGLHLFTVRNTEDPHYGIGKKRGEDLYESANGFIVHFFCREKAERLAKGYELISISAFEEGDLPRKLYLVLLKKPHFRHNQP